MLQVNLPNATLLLVSQGCPFAMVSTASLPPSGVLSGSTPPQTLNSAREKKKDGKRERDRERNIGKKKERERYIYIDPIRASRFPIARPRVHTLSTPDPRSRSTNVSIGTDLNYRNVSPISLL